MDKVKVKKELEKLLEAGTGPAPLSEWGGALIRIGEAGVKVWPPRPKGAGVPADEYFGAAATLQVCPELETWALELLIDKLTPILAEAVAGVGSKWGEALDRGRKVIDEYCNNPDYWAYFVDPYDLITDNGPLTIENLKKLWPAGLVEKALEGDTLPLAEYILKWASEEDMAVSGGLRAIVEAIEEAVKRGQELGG